MLPKLHFDEHFQLSRIYSNRNIRSLTVSPQQVARKAVPGRSTNRIQQNPTLSLFKLHHEERLLVELKRLERSLPENQNGPPCGFPSGSRLTSVIPKSTAEAAYLVLTIVANEGHMRDQLQHEDDSIDPTSAKNTLEYTCLDRDYSEHP